MYPSGYLPLETGDVEGQGADAAVDVDVPREAPARHLQVVEAHALLEQVVALLIVDLENVLAPWNLTQETFQTLDLVNCVRERETLT